MTRLFKKNGYFIIIEKDKNEFDDQFTERGMFIVSQKPQNENELNECIRYSRIFRNVKFNKCKYDNETMDMLKNMELNLYDE